MAVVTSGKHKGQWHSDEAVHKQADSADDDVSVRAYRTDKVGVVMTLRAIVEHKRDPSTNSQQ